MYGCILILVVIAIVMLIYPSIYSKIVGFILLLLALVISYEYIVFTNKLKTTRSSLLIEPYKITDMNSARDYINKHIKQDIKVHEQNIDNIGSKLINEAIQYSMTDGKNIRSMIAIDICNSVSKNRINSIYYAMAIEYIHCSSLIIDDMPYFDDDKLRRGKTSLHVKYDQAIAHMTALSLLSYSFKCISNQLKIIHGHDGDINYKLEIADKITNLYNEIFDINGLPSYVILEDKMANVGVIRHNSRSPPAVPDLSNIGNRPNIKYNSTRYNSTIKNNDKYSTKNNNEKTRKTKDNDIIMTPSSIFVLEDKTYTYEEYEDLLFKMDLKKTGFLFKIAIKSGWYIGCLTNKKKYNKECEKDIDTLCNDFGLAYQIYDDIDDYTKDKESGKQNINYAVLYGMDKAKTKLRELLNNCGSILTRLNLMSPFWEELLLLLYKAC